MCYTRTGHSIKLLEPAPSRPNGTIWTVPAIHGDLERLTKLHDHIYEYFKMGDQIVYLGNYTGYGDDGAACVDEVLTFRRMILSVSGVVPDDLTYLRGTQEEIWKKMLQIPFAQKPVDILLWMLGQGVGPTLKSYGFCPHDAMEACQFGTIGLTRWVNKIRETIRLRPGHDLFFSKLKRAAHTGYGSPTPLLFVHAGLDADRALEDQGDSFWWGANRFEAMDAAYNPFQKVIRGFDPAHGGLNLNCIKATIDDGCGFGGRLVSAGFSPQGSIEHVLEA